MENIETTFKVSMNFDSLDEKLQRFIMLRNELAMLAEEIGIDVRGRLIFAEKASPSAATDGLLDG